MIKHTLLAASLFIAAGQSMAAAPGTALSLPGYFGSINNNTAYVVECAQMIGGYCANNPMPADGFIQMLPDPGSKMMRGHLMLFSKDQPGHYVDNIVFTYSENKDGSWAFKINGSYQAVKVTSILPDTVLLSSKTATK